MSFSPVARDHRSYQWDLILSGKWCVSDPKVFCTKYALDAVSPELPLTCRMVESWIAVTRSNQVCDAVNDTAGEHADIERIRDRDVLPAQWWTGRLCEWLKDCGVSVAITAKPGWESADEARAKAEQHLKDELNRFALRRRQQREAELERTREEARYERERIRIERENSDCEDERRRQLELLELGHRAQVIRVNTEIQKAEQDAELAAIEHGRKLAQIRNDIKTIEQVQSREQDANRRHEQMDALLAEGRKLLEISKAVPSVLAQLALGDQEKSFQAAERLVSPEFDVDPGALGVLGFRTSRQTVLQMVREKAHADGNAVRLWKANLQARCVPRVRVSDGRARDIGAARVDGLPIGKSLQFEFTSRRTGYVTFINVGTSGKVWLHIPNAYVAAYEARAISDRKYEVPGPELLPVDQMRMAGLDDYVEIGPPGWEHVVVFVSDEPLLDSGVLCRARPDAPFVDLSSDELDALVGHLNSLQPEKWTAAALSFLVVEK